MTVDEWLSSRQPPPPERLLGDLRAALGPKLTSDATDSAPIFLAAAERLLRELVASGETDRSTASTLLTIDALTTYALESASETARDLSVFSDDAIARFTATPSGEEPKKAT